MTVEGGSPLAEEPTQADSLSLEERRFVADEDQRRFEREHVAQQYASDEAHRLDERRREGIKLGRWRLLATSAVPLLGPSVAALIAFLASLHAERTNTATALQVESLRDQSQLILQTLNGRTQPQTIVALQFLAKAGMIPDYQQTVLKLTSDQGGAAIPADPIFSTPGHPFGADDQFGEVMTLPNGKVMQLPRDMHCRGDVFVPKIGQALRCFVVFIPLAGSTPFDERAFENNLPGSKAR